MDTRDFLQVLNVATNMLLRDGTPCRIEIAEDLRKQTGNMLEYIDKLEGKLEEYSNTKEAWSGAK